MPMNPKAPHGEDGKLIQTVDSVETDALACDLRSRGWSYAEIAERIGDPSGQYAYQRVKRAMESIIQEPAEEARQFELDRLDRMWRKVQAVLDDEHITVQHGKVVYDQDGNPLPDHDPVMKAVATMLKIQERRSKLLGLDAAQKTQVSGGVKYELVGVDMAKLT